GLTHVDDPARIMYPFVSHGAVWGDGCAGFDTRTGPILCRDSHLELCADGQNAHAELLAMFGADSADTHAPIVRILGPLDGVEIPPGGGVTVVAEIEDDYEGFGWKLAIPELHWEAVGNGGSRPWRLPGFPAGATTRRVQATTTTATSDSTRCGSTSGYLRARPPRSTPPRTTARTKDARAEWAPPVAVRVSSSSSRGSSVADVARDAGENTILAQRWNAAGFRVTTERSWPPIPICAVENSAATASSASWAQAAWGSCTRPCISNSAVGARSRCCDGGTRVGWSSASGSS